MFRGTTLLHLVSAGQTRPAYGELVPLASEEFTDAAQQVVTRYRVILPPAAGPVVGTDQVLVAGVLYGVKGDSEPHRLKGRLHHFEVVVERVQG